MPDCPEPLPPQSLEAEQALLGALMLASSPAVRRVARIVGPGDFYRTQHQHIFRAALLLADADTPVDPVTIATELRRRNLLEPCGGFDYLDRLLRSCPYSGNVERYAATVREKALLRRAGEAALGLAQQALAPGAEPDAVIEAAMALTGRLTRRRRCVDDSQLTGAAAVSVWRERTRRQGTPIPTGFRKLDRLLRGGWRRAQLHTLTARPKQGKSALVCHFISAAVEAGVKVGLLSLEMPFEEILARLTAIRCHLPYGLLENGLDHVERSGPRGPQWARDAEADAAFVLERLVIDEASSYGAAELTRRLWSLREEHGCELLIVDLVNNVSGRGRTGEERAASVNEALHDAAHPQRLGVPVLAVAQQNREGEGRPGLASIKGTGTYEERSVFVMALRRWREHGVDHGEVEVLANRGGATGKFALLGDLRTLGWREDDSRPDDLPDDEELPEDPCPPERDPWAP